MSPLRAGAAVAIAVCAAVLAQDAKFAVDVNVVNVLATVRDRDGRIVTNLTKDDFVLKEDGKAQEIRYFAHQTDLPLTIGLLVDTSMSQAGIIREEREASYQFLEKVLRPEKDQAFIIKFDYESELLQDLTSSRKDLEAALKLLGVPGRSGFPPARRGRRGGRSRGPRAGGSGAGTVLYDAAYLAADEVLRDQPGRKAIVLISDGVDAGSKVALNTAIEYAQRADAIVYSIRYFDEYAYRGRRMPNGKRTLERISEETGGKMFEVTKKAQLDTVFAEINEEIRNQYSIGYTPVENSAAGFRKLELSAKDKKLKVQARNGYYPKTGPAETKP